MTHTSGTDRSPATPLLQAALSAVDEASGGATEARLEQALRVWAAFTRHDWDAVRSDCNNHLAERLDDETCNRAWDNMVGAHGEIGAARVAGVAKDRFRLHVTLLAVQDHMIVNVWFTGDKVSGFTMA